MLVAFVILPYGCEKDDSLLNEEQIIEPNIKIENVTLSKSKHHNKLSHLLKANENNSFNRNSNENEDFHQNFTIDTSSIKYIEGPVSHSYTFALINKTQDSEEINNLVIAKHNDMEHYIALHFKYELSSIELLNIENGIYPQEFQNEPVIEEIQNFDFSITSGHHRAGCVTYNTIYYDVPCSHPEHQAAHEFNPCGHPEGQQTITVTVISDCPNSPNLGDGTNTDTSSGSGSSGGGGGGINWGGSNTNTTQNNDPGVLGDGPLTQINVPFRSKIRTDLIDNLDVEDLRFLDAYPHVEMALNTLLVNNPDSSEFIIWSINYLQNLYLVGTLLNHPFELNLFNSIVNSNLNNQEIINLLAFHELAEEAIQNGGEVDFEEQIIKDPSLPNCIKSIIDDLIAENSFLDLGDMDSIVLEQLNLAGHIMSTFNNSDNYSLIFKMANLEPNANGDYRNAETNPRPSTTVPGNFVITITLDTSYVSNATDLALARTILHESLHAYLTFLTQEYFVSTLAQRLTSLSLNLNNDINSAQHIEMSNNFVYAIANALQSWHNSALSNNSYYNYLAWSGDMLSTTAFQQQTENFQNNVLNANLAEGSAGPNGASTSAALGNNNSNCP